MNSRNSISNRTVIYVASALSFLAFPALAGWNPSPIWKDSDAVDGGCSCDSYN